MLSFKPPFLNVGNLTVFRDDTDSSVFYYISSRPKVSLGKDGTPALSAYAILPRSGVDGTTSNVLEAGLNIDVELSVSEDELLVVQEQIKEQFGVESAVLSPASVHDGTVDFRLAQAGDNPDSAKWFITSGFQPSLIGNNRASIVVRTTGTDAERLIASADAGEVLSVVSYKIGIVGVTPVYHARLSADMAQIYHSFEKTDNSNYIFYTKEIEDKIEELQQTNALNIEVEETDPDIKAEAMSSLLNNLTSKVIDELFSEEESSEENMLSQLAEAASGLVSSLIPGKHYSRKEVDATTLNTITIDLSQKNAKIQYCYPQTGFKSMIDEAGVKISDIISWIKLDELPYFSQTVNVNLASNTFENSNINSIAVFCRVKNLATGEYTGEQTCLVFDSKKEAISSEFNYVRECGTDYCCEYRLELYINTGSSRIPGKIDIDWQESGSSYIYINPCSYSKEFELDLNLADTSVFDYAQTIQADLSMLTDDGNELLAKTFIFTKEENEHRKLSLYTGNELSLKYNVKLTYFLPEAKEHIAEYNGNDSIFFFIPNPFEHKWSVDLVCKADWQNVAKVYLDTRIYDAERKDPIVNHFQFTQDCPQSRLEASCSLDTKEYDFEYMETVAFTDGTSTKAGWYSSPRKQILTIFADSITPELVVRAKLADPSIFTKNNLSFFKVEFTVDKDSGESLSQNITAEGEVVEFKYKSSESDSNKYWYRFSAKDCDKNPVFKRKKWTEADEEVLELEITEEDRL